MEHTSLPRAPKLRKVLLSKAFFSSAVKSLSSLNGHLLTGDETGCAINLAKHG